MKKALTHVFAVALVASAITGVASAADPVMPFPATKVGQVFVAAQVVTTDGTLNSWFAPGSTVVFRAYAINPETKLPVEAKQVRYFYVTIPNQPNVKLKLDAKAPGASAGLPWSGQWTVPASYPEGLVNFKVLIQVRSKANKQLRGQFVQMPVMPSQLNISSTAPATIGTGGAGGAGGAGTGQALDLALYVDTVNGSRPPGAAPRKIGCTQTNVYKRGEQVVVRAWGTDLATGGVLSTDNVKDAHFSIPGQADIALNWGPHGATGAKVWFWTNFWNIPADFPLGEVTLHVVYTLESGKTGSYDHVLNIIP